jgi:hypothetical protein
MNIDQAPSYFYEFERLAIIAAFVYIVALGWTTIGHESDLSFVEERFNAMCWVGLDFQDYCLFFDSGERCRLEFYCPGCWSKYNCTQMGDLNEA